MSEIQLHVRGCTNNFNADCISPVFAWRAPAEYKQFTVELARDAEFKEIIFLRDTHEHFCVYDSVPLKGETTYYLRVRSGVGEWQKIEFTTRE